MPSDVVLRSLPEPPGRALLRPTRDRRRASVYLAARRCPAAGPPRRAGATALRATLRVAPAAPASRSACGGLFGLAGLAVARVVTDDVEGRVVHLVTADETAAGCPSCGVISVLVKGRVTSRPQDLPHGPAGLSLVWHKRRWRCAETACERLSFTESLPAVPARARLTTRLRAELGSAVADSGRTVAEVAAFHRIGWPTVHRAFVDHVTPALSAPPPVTVLEWMRPAAGNRSSPKTPRPAAGWWWPIGGTPASSMPPAPAGCWRRSRAGRRPPSPDVWPTSQTRGGSRSPMWRSTCRRPTPLPCAPVFPTR
ncbi:zinc-finger of transposase IS204/IS1001/IS1096/IS1165 [Modestobacter sp. DSM 44400]|nr:zinc-finger of transposase IS204/IS1001/IS1096/IS1165 [Modestobacter sp. DSM 44400]